MFQICQTFFMNTFPKKYHQKIPILLQHLQPQQNTCAEIKMTEHEGKKVRINQLKPLSVK